MKYLITGGAGFVGSNIATYLAERNETITIIDNLSTGNLDNIKDMLEVPILGIIPEDIAVKESQVMKNSVIHTHPRSKASKSYIKTSKRLLGDDVRFDNPGLGILGRILKGLGLK